MNISQLHTVYFIGIGGIGMSALARYFHMKGANVSGFDRTQTSLTKQLEKQGIYIHYLENEGKIPEHIDLVVYTPAINEQNVELKYCRSRNFTIKKRAEVLGLLTKNSHTLAIAGTHGKTSVSSMLTHIVHQSKGNCTAFVGGIMKNYETNLMVSVDEKYMVVEADEFDRSFHFLNPKVGLITSTDSDHLDVYGNEENMKEAFKQFADNIDDKGVLIIKKGLDIARKAGLKTYTYGLDANADFAAVDVKPMAGRFHFDVQWPGNQLKNISLQVGGIHNVENAVAAIAVAFQIGINKEEISKALRTYKGVKRRFEVVFQSANCIYIDDYAHHPAELKATIQSARQLYPGKRITGIFQPHLFTRTRDFADGFAESLDLLDEALLMQIYPAREEPIEGINSRLILSKMKLADKQLIEPSAVYTKVEKNQYDVLLTMGAGDIDKLVSPLKSILERKFLK